MSMARIAARRLIFESDYRQPFTLNQLTGFAAAGFALAALAVWLWGTVI